MQKTALSYPRDLPGYGSNTPDPKWSGSANVAVQFALNYGERGETDENCILHGDTSSEAFHSEIVGAQPWPGQRHWNMGSIYDYGAGAGYWRLHRLFAELNVPVTVYGVATALARSPAHVEAMSDTGWETASHGLKWIEYKDFSREDQHTKADILDAFRRRLGNDRELEFTVACRQVERIARLRLGDMLR